MRIEIKQNGNVVKTFNTIGGLKTLNKTLMQSVFNEEIPTPFTMDMVIGRLVTSKEFDSMPTEKSLKDDFAALMSDIAAFRSENKKLTEEKRTAIMGALTYKTIGGVFTKVNSINSLIGPEFKRNLIEVSKKPNSGEKRSYVGLELEFCAMLDGNQIKEKFIEANLHRYVQLGSDGSVTPHKGGRSFELRVICLESEVETVVPKICGVLTSKEVGGYVNSTCGFHVHMDCRFRDAEHAFKNLVMGLPLLSAMVPQERVTGMGGGRTHYCKQNNSGNFKVAAKAGDRYLAVNPMSYNEHKTVEVRLHSGTLNAKKIINWVKTLATLVNHNKTLTRKIKTVEEFANLTTDADLCKYMDKRVKLFAATNLDTLADEMIDTMLENGTLAQIVNL